MVYRKTSFKTSPQDEEFRRIMRDLIDKSEGEIIVVTGEGGAFRYYQELRWAIKRAIERGVKVKVYAKSPEQAMVNKLVDYGAEVYLGNEVPKDHYTVLDKKIVVESLEHEPDKTGVRKGLIHSKPRKVKEKVSEFNGYIKNAVKAKIDRSADPLLKVLKKPLQLSFETDSGHIDLNP